MFETIISEEDYQIEVEQNEAVLFYFSHEQCNVCKVLKPKIAELIESDFPKIKLYYCDTVHSPELAAQNRIFTVPTIVVFFGGKEFLRKSRNMGIDELSDELKRPYEMVFNS